MHKHKTIDAFIRDMERLLATSDKERRQRLLEELRGHLEDATEAVQRSGVAAPEAVALAKMGTPEVIALQLLTEPGARLGFPQALFAVSILGGILNCAAWLRSAHDFHALVQFVFFFLAAVSCPWLSSLSTMMWVEESAPFLGRWRWLGSSLLVAFGLEMVALSINLTAGGMTAEAMLTLLTLWIWLFTAFATFFHAVRRTATE
jgi:hypothetical protein